jgi:tryptophan synthase alpha chain
MNRIDELFVKKPDGILNIYCTAGYPALDSTLEVMRALQEHGADMIELGIPFSDPLADGPVIQQSGMQAIHNGMTIPVLLEKLADFRSEIQLPVIMMGYMNPVLQYGVANFLRDAAAVGVDGIILPDLPMFEFETVYKPLFEQYGLHFIFLITPETSEERIRKIDELSRGFIYAVSSSATTGKDTDMSAQAAYFKRLEQLQLKNPLLVGFGIRDYASFSQACAHSQGAIIGSAYIKAITDATDINITTRDFIRGVITPPLV